MALTSWAMAAFLGPVALAMSAARGPGYALVMAPGVVCGHLATTDIRKSDGARIGAGMAKAGLIIGYAAAALSLVAQMLWKSWTQ